MRKELVEEEKFAPSHHLVTQILVAKRCTMAPKGTYVAINVLLDKEVVDGFNVLVLSSICSSDDSTNSDGILIY